MKYVLMSYGLFDCPEYAEYTAAKTALSSLVESSLKACRAKYGAAKKVKTGEDSYKIEFGANLWGAYWLDKE